MPEIVADHHRFELRRAPWLALLAIFALSLFAYTRHNDFAFYDHPDEPGKVRQIRENDRNFHHPLLMLNATDLALRLSGVERTRQNIAVTGRWVSAVFASCTVVIFGLVAFYYYGAFASIS